MHSVAVLIDRRVDPGGKVDLTVEKMPLSGAFQTLAQGQELGSGMVGPVLVLGPADAVARVRTLAAIHAEELRKAPEDVRLRFLQSAPLAWKDFATPRGLLEQLARQYNLKLEGLEKVPHDLWAAADLPPLRLCDRLLLVTAQFDLDFQIIAGGQTVEIVPAAENPTLVREYDAGRDPKATAEKFPSLAPGAQIRNVGGKLEVRASIDDHERLNQSPQPVKRPVRPAKGDAVQTHTLVVQGAPLGKVLDQMAAQLKFELQIDRKAIDAAGISLDQTVSVNVKNVTVDKLLAEVLKPTPLTFHRKGNPVVISPR